MTRADLDLDAVNRQLDGADAEAIVAWAAGQFGDGLALSSSFGIQAAVMLHLVTRIVPDVPVIWVDTGFLLQETYRFAEELTRRLKLNLKVYQSPLSPGRMSALYGPLWEKDDLESLNQYDQIRKVEPMDRALRELGVTALLAGVRSEQTELRKSLSTVGLNKGVYRVHPILTWPTKQVHEYLKRHDLPYHPLRDQGYETIGDWHSSRPLTAEDPDARATRFRGLKQECGIHIPETKAEDQSRESSGL